MVKTFSLENKIILVTGGYGHLGKAISESLVYHGAKVYVLGRSKDKFEEAFDENARSNPRLLFSYCDVSETKSIKNALEQIYENNSQIDVLINNAIFSEGQSPEDLTDKDWNTGIDGVLGSVFRCIREIIPYFKRLGKGKIINVSSMYGIVAPDFEIYNSAPKFLNPPHYGAAKAGVIQLTKYYASFLGSHRINVNTVTPGPFPSESVQLNKDFMRKLNDKTSLNKIGTPEDLAGAFVFLASEASNFITGQNIIVDGGWTSK